MGWNSGSYLAQDTWDDVKDFIPEDRKRDIARAIYLRFCERDADDWDESSDLLKYALSDDEILDKVRDQDSLTGVIGVLRTYKRI